MVRVKEHMQPLIRAAWSATSEPPAMTSGKALSVSTTHSHSPARGPSVSVHLTPLPTSLTTPRSNLSTHIPLKLQHTYPPFPAIYMICTAMGWQCWCRACVQVLSTIPWSHLTQFRWISQHFALQNCPPKQNKLRETSLKTPCFTFINVCHWPSWLQIWVSAVISVNKPVFVFILIRTSQVALKEMQ